MTYPSLVSSLPASGVGSFFAAAGFVSFFTTAGLVGVDESLKYLLNSSTCLSYANDRLNWKKLLPYKHCAKISYESVCLWCQFTEIPIYNKISVLCPNRDKLYNKQNNNICKNQNKNRVDNFGSNSDKFLVLKEKW